MLQSDQRLSLIFFPLLSSPFPSSPLLYCTLLSSLILSYRLLYSPIVSYTPLRTLWWSRHRAECLIVQCKNWRLRLGCLDQFPCAVVRFLRAEPSGVWRAGKTIYRGEFWLDDTLLDLDLFPVPVPVPVPVLRLLWSLDEMRWDETIGVKGNAVRRFTSCFSYPGCWLELYTFSIVVTLYQINGDKILFTAIDGSATPVSRVRSTDLNTMLMWAKREVPWKNYEDCD